MDETRNCRKVPAPVPHIGERGASPGACPPRPSVALALTRTPPAMHSWPRGLLAPARRAADARRGLIDASWMGAPDVEQSRLRGRFTDVGPRFLPSQVARF
jgi:hypothetical protein